MKKVWPLAALTLITATSLLSAGNSDDMKPEQGAARGVTAPTARGDLRDSKGAFITADVFYWKANVDGMTPTITNNILTSPATNSSAFYSSSFNHLNHKWDPGFKLGIGGNLNHDEWDLYLNWTYFRNRASMQQEADPQTTPATQLFAIWSAFTPAAATSSPLQTFEVHSKWRLHLNMIDLELGRKLYVGKWLAVRPHAGLRGAWIHQNYNVNYFGGTQFGTSPEEIYNKNRFNGGGIRAGFDTQWNLGSGFSLYGNAAISIMYGKFKIDQKEYRGPNQDPSFLLLNINDHFHASRAITDLALGLRYEHMFKDASGMFTVSLGWEQHMFFDQNELKRFNSFTAATSGPITSTTYTPDNGKNLSTQGFTLSFRFDF